MNKETVVDEVELGLINEQITPISYRGRVVNVVDLDRAFLSHKFSKATLSTIFWAQFDLDWMGG
jgi:hypothetical protein